MTTHTEIQKYCCGQTLMTLFFALKFKTKVTEKEGPLPTEAKGREGAGLKQSHVQESQKRDFWINTVCGRNLNRRKCRQEVRTEVFWGSLTLPLHQLTVCCCGPTGAAEAFCSGCS